MYGSIWSVGYALEAHFQGTEGTCGTCYKRNGGGLSWSILRNFIKACQKEWQL